MSKERNLAAIVLAASRFEYERAEALPQCTGTAKAFINYLKRDARVPANRILSVIDEPAGPSEVIDRIRHFLATVTESTGPSLTDVIFFYSGHGVIQGTDYYLLLPLSRKNNAASSLRWPDLVTSLHASAGDVRHYMIVDACFAGMAAQPPERFRHLASSISPRASLTPTKGVSVLAATSPAHTTSAPRESELTSFAEALFHALRPRHLDDGPFALSTLRDRSNEYIVSRHPAQASPALNSIEQTAGDVSNFPLFPPLHDALEGIAPREEVFGTKALPGQVFAIEVLERPVMLHRERSENYVTIDRTGVNWGVYTRTGKTNLSRIAMPDANSVRRAIEVDTRVHAFLLGQGDDRPLPVEQRYLRWASGGVLSVVEWGDNKHWIPFFFRDVEPRGWNISLGASERGDDLDDPWTFVMREFLEETLVLTSDPDDGPRLKCRRFEFDRMAMDPMLGAAGEFFDDHIAQRYDRDLLDITVDHTKPIVPTFLPTKTSLSIRGQEKPISNVLISINTLELGIEVVKVLSYKLAPDDYVLDGETYWPQGQRTPILVRMPVALISLRYLEEVFGSTSSISYSGEGVQQSILLESPIPAADIRVFGFDVRRRWEVDRTVRIRQPEQSGMYSDWISRFGGYFFAGEPDSVGGKPAAGEGCPLFTPASAKLVSYYLANRRTLSGSR